MLTWITNVFKGIFSSPLAWLVQAVAAAGGIAVSDTWIGRTLGWFVNLFPIYTPHILFVAAIFIIGLDWFREGIPERLALYLSLVAPSLAMAIPDDAKLHEKMAGWITDVNTWLDTEIGPWVTGPNAKNAVLTIIGLICVTIVVIYNEPQLLDKISGRRGSRNSTFGSSSSTAGTPVTRSSRRARSS